MGYTTTSGFSDLDGSCEITGNNCSSYNSTARGAGTVTNKGGPGLHFHVNFSGVTHPYVIHATARGTGYSGNAQDNSDGDAEESWAAAATAVQEAVAGAGSQKC